MVHLRSFTGCWTLSTRAGIASETLRRDVVAGADAASAAYADMGRFLRDEYVPRAAEQDGVGEERYSLSSRVFNGIELDFSATYDWGWEQLRWVESEMAKTAEKILPGASVEAAKDLLETDPARAIEGVDAFRRWMQEIQDATIAELKRNTLRDTGAGCSGLRR